jgi:hypothetical protein
MSGEGVKAKGNEETLGRQTEKEAGAPLMRASEPRQQGGATRSKPAPPQAARAGAPSPQA